MLSDVIASQLAVSSTEERLDQYRLSAEKLRTVSEARKLVSHVFENWAIQIPDRDRVSLTIGYDGDTVSITDFSAASLSRVQSLLDSYDEADSCRMSVDLVVHKTVMEQRLSLYSPVLFGKYLENTPTLQVLKVLAEKIKGNLIFESRCPINHTGSASISFQAVSNKSPTFSRAPSATDQKTTLDIFRDNGFSRSLPGGIVPQDFELTKTTGIPSIDDFFAKSRTLISIVFIASSAEILDTDILEYRICGYKILAGAGSLSEFSAASDLLYKIATWAYGEGGSSEKIGLSRNVLSLYLEKLQDLHSHPEVLNAINSNYQIYLKENVENYLEIKGKIADILVDAVKKTHDLVDGFIDSLKNGIFVLLTFVLTVVVVNGLKDTSASAIFSTTYIWVVVVLSLLMSIWVFSAKASALSQFDRAFSSIEELIKRNYQGILAPEEVDSALNPVRASNRAYLEKQSAHYARVWSLIVLFLIAGFILGNAIFTTATSSAALQAAPPVATSATPTQTPATVSSESKPTAGRAAQLGSGNPLNRRVEMRHSNPK